MLSPIIMQNSRLIHACFPIKIDEVWIDRFCVRYDWWRRLQPTSSVSPVWYGGRDLGQHWFSNHSGNGLLPDGTKSLPEPMLTYHHFRSRRPVMLIWGQFCLRYHSHQSLKISLKIISLRIYWNLPGANELSNLPSCIHLVTSSTDSFVTRN